MVRDAFGSDPTQAMVEQIIHAVQGRKNRRGMVLSFLAALCASAAIALPVAIHDGNANAHTQRLNQHHAEKNCRLITKLAEIQKKNTQEQLESTASFRHNSKSTFGLTQGQFDKLIAEGEIRQQKLASTEAELATINCQAE